MTLSHLLEGLNSYFCLLICAVSSQVDNKSTGNGSTKPISIGDSQSYKVSNLYIFDISVLQEITIYNSSINSIPSVIS